MSQHKSFFSRWGRIRNGLLALFLTLGFGIGIPPVYGQEPTPKASPEVQELTYQGLFTEEVLTVSRERDGILPGTLRSALIQASGIRSQNSFALVKIVFEPGVKRVRVTKGPLPEMDGSLTTLDCQSAGTRVIIEGVAPEDSAGMDPTLEWAGLKITSNGNTVRGCHITGFPGPGILIRGNRNVIENNALGYHPDIPETTVPASALYEDPKTNQGAGIQVDQGANANEIHHNDIVANTYHGILISEAAGSANQIGYNFFAANSGEPIKALPGSNHTPKPTIQNIKKVGDTYYIEGRTTLRSKVQIYMAGEQKGSVGMMVAEGQGANTPRFVIATKSKGFVVGETRLVAVAQGINQNTSEFSDTYLLKEEPPAQVISPADSLESPTPPSPADHEVGAEDEEEENVEVRDTQEVAEGIRKLSPVPRDPRVRQIPADQEESNFNIQGMGTEGGEPDHGVESPGQNEVSSLGI